MSTPHNATAYPPDHLYIDTPAETAAEVEAAYEAAQAEYDPSLPATRAAYLILTEQDLYVDPLPTPVISGFNPATAIADAAATPIFISVLGSGFVPESVVNWEGADVATTYTDATTLGVTVPSAIAAADVPVYVKNVTVIGTPVNFSFTVAADPEVTTAKKKSKKG
jgi:hypothetical protein